MKLKKPQRRNHHLVGLYKLNGAPMLNRAKLRFEQRAKRSFKDRFVIAMVQIGFVARHNGGSAVLFEPNGECKWYPFGGKIVFHRPHPDPTLTPLILKFMGKRFHKRFSWCAETFVLKK
jgi:hypothetical protein